MEIVVDEILPKSPKGSGFCDKLGKKREFEGWGKMGGRTRENGRWGGDWQENSTLSQG